MKTRIISPVLITLFLVLIASFSGRGMNLNFTAGENEKSQPSNSLVYKQLIILPLLVVEKSWTEDFKISIMESSLDGLNTIEYLTEENFRDLKLDLQQLISKSLEELFAEIEIGKRLDYLKFNAPVTEDSEKIDELPMKKNLDYLQFDVNEFDNNPEETPADMISKFDYLKFAPDSFEPASEPEQAAAEKNLEYLKFDPNAFGNLTSDEEESNTPNLSYLKFNPQNLVESPVREEKDLSELDYLRFDVNNLDSPEDEGMEFEDAVVLQ